MVANNHKNNKKHSQWEGASNMHRAKKNDLLEEQAGRSKKNDPMEDQAD